MLYHGRTAGDIITLTGGQILIDVREELVAQASVEMERYGLAWKVFPVMEYTHDLIGGTEYIDEIN